jgi:DNA-binding GntR family transcriptional regulator
MLVTGAVGPHDDLDEASLTRRLNHGRTPLREALKRLTHEGFVIWPPRRPPRPVSFDMTAMQRLWEARLVLEETVARFAAIRISDEQLTRVSELCEAIRHAVLNQNTYEATEYDYAFHVAVAEGSDNPYMADTVSHLNCVGLPLWYRAHRVFGTEDSYADHNAIVQALASRDPEAAAATVVDHIRLSYARQLRMLELELGDPLASLSPTRFTRTSEAIKGTVADDVQPQVHEGTSSIPAPDRVDQSNGASNPGRTQ